MNRLRGIFHFYINASIHVALAVTSLVCVASFALNITATPYLYLFIFFGTISGYNFVKFAPVAGSDHKSLSRSLRLIQIFSLLCAPVAMYALFQLPTPVWGVAAIMGLLTFLYTVPFWKKKSLRGFSGWKIFIVALVWAGVGVFIPLTGSKESLTADVCLLFFQLFFLVQVWTLPFEIRDLKYDPLALRTLPQQLGVKKAKGYGLGLLMLTVLLEGFKDELNPYFLASLMCVCALSGFFLIKSKKEASVYFASFWVESLPILWYALLLMIHRFW